MEEDKYFSTDDYHAFECPHCHHKNDFMESLDDLVTMWGEGDIVERECHECEKTFVIQESVSRSWETAKTADELF